MHYNKEIYGITLKRDVYAEHFAEPGDIEIEYALDFCGCVVDEDENPRALAKRIHKYALRLSKIANFLEKIGSKNANTKTSKAPLQENT